LIYVTDIFIGFRTTHIDPNSGEEITDGYVNGMLYFRGNFWIDFLSSVPFDVYFPQAPFMRVLGLLKA
jgi:hypothetical protein